ncbi:helix-turn-helix domain-containing protein [Streptomyces sp. bgisy060]|uniref:helix-turn-helix domain-containing protein n=1 Tax=Streptomyces sp. bgisy060 TaxID=3413775 RepID=UPI003EBB4518
MPPERSRNVNELIQHYRKLRGYTQDQLAVLAGVSVSHISKIEQGRKHPSPGTVNALADALKVHPAVLNGQPYVEELEDDKLHELVQPLRAALDLYDIPPDMPTRDRADLAAAADQLCARVRRTELRAVAAALPALLQEATTAAHTGRTDGDWATLASLFRTAYDVAAKLGYHDLSSLALERMAWAAERASDATVVAMRQYMRALVHMRSGTYTPGQQLILSGHTLLEQAEPGRVRDVLTGQLHLGQAVLAARSADAATAEEHLREAARFAEITGEAGRVHWLSFGPTNVEVHRVSTLVEMCRDTEAVEVARRIEFPVDWAPSRIAHHHCEVAKALTWTGHRDEAFGRLLEAKRIAPQQTRHFPQARAVLDDLVDAARTSEDTLAGLARWFGR